MAPGFPFRQFVLTHASVSRATAARAFDARLTLPR
jgi:hypothetical protein